jgi:cytochrome c
MSQHLVLLLAIAVVAPGAASAETSQEQRGKILALYNCARCHAVDRDSPSKLKTAPPFRTLHIRFPVETLIDRLGKGISAGHPRMPPFPLGPDQVADLMAFLKTLE